MFLTIYYSTYLNLKKMAVKNDSKHRERIKAGIEPSIIAGNVFCVLNSMLSCLWSTMQNIKSTTIKKLIERICDRDVTLNL